MQLLAVEVLLLLLVLRVLASTAAASTADAATTTCITTAASTAACIATHSFLLATRCRGLCFVGWHVSDAEERGEDVAGYAAGDRWSWMERWLP